MSGPEKLFERKVRKLLDSSDAWVLKTWSNGTQRTGVPDILCCLCGYFIAIEVKASTGHPSDLQLKELYNIHRAGGIAILLYPKDYETFRKLIATLLARYYHDFHDIPEYEYFHELWNTKYERMIEHDTL